MKKICENCQSESKLTELHGVELCESCYNVEMIAILELQSIIKSMLKRGIPAKSILERFDLHNSL